MRKRRQLDPLIRIRRDLFDHVGSELYTKYNEQCNDFHFKWHTGLYHIVQKWLEQGKA
jgi:hypothetical protein